ncbi:hypothetical protein GGF46_002339 [Coemansia sp. RSA 552]|nr:hypothetical protein GGF46_002339 [Coemansia sp. RSA 552]
MKRSFLTVVGLVAMAGAVLADDTYQRSPCNAVHWTRVLEGKISWWRAATPSPFDVKSVIAYEHDLPANQPHHAHLQR